MNANCRPTEQQHPFTRLNTCIIRVHMIPICQPASGKRKCSEPIMPSIGQTDSHTAATAYPTIPLTVLTQGRNAIRIEIRRVGFSQHLHFLSFLINQDTTVIGSEPYFSILTLNNCHNRMLPLPQSPVL